MKKTVACLCLAGLFTAAPAEAVTRTWQFNIGGVWTNADNWAGGLVPGANDTADLSAAIGKTISLTANATVGEILYNPVFSGTTNTLTIQGDASLPTLTLSNTATTPDHIQVGTGAVLALDADLSLSDSIYKDGYGVLDLKRQVLSSAIKNVFIEKGKMIVGGAFLAINKSQIYVGCPNSDTGFPYPELIVRDGAALRGENFLLGGNRLTTNSTNAHAVVTQLGGEVNLPNTGTSSPFLNAFYNDGVTSVYHLVNGVLNVSNKASHVAYRGVGTFNQSGGTSIFYTVTMATTATGKGTYNLTGGELWLGGTVSKGSGTSAFNIGGGSIYPCRTGFTINADTNPQLTGSNGLTRLCSAGSGFTNTVSGLKGAGGFVKEGADTLNIAGSAHAFAGPMIVSNGTVNVSQALTVSNAVLVAGGVLNLNANVAFGSLTVTGGVFQVAANSVLAVTGGDPRVRVTGAGTLRFLAGAFLPGLTVLDVDESGSIDLSAGGSAFVNRLVLGGVEQAAGLYTSANCAAITGPGMLVVNGGLWSGAGGDGMWSNGANWLAGTLPNGLITVADLSGAVSNASPAATLALDPAAVTNGWLRFASGVSGATLTNTCPAGVTNTLYVASEGVIYVGGGETLVLDHDLCLMGTIYKRGGGALVLKRKTFALPSLVTPVSTIYLCVEDGQVIGAGPMTNVLVMAGKPDRSAPGATPEFTLEDTPEAAIGGTSFICAMSALATSLNPGNGVFTQKGGTVEPGINWGTRSLIGFAVSGASLGGTGTYNLVGGTLKMTNALYVAANNGKGVFNQTGGLLDVYSFAPAGGAVHLTGGQFLVSAFNNGASAYCTFYLGGGRMEPRTSAALSLTSPVVFTGINGDMTFAPAAGRAVTLSGATSGAGGFVKDGDGTLTFSAISAFSGLATVSNGTLAVSGSLAGTNDVLLLNGAFSIAATGTAKLGELAVTNGAVDLASGVVATAERFFVEGSEWAKGVYASTNCSKITGAGLLIVGAEPGQWTNGGSDDNWNTAANWVAGILPNGLYSVANLSACVSNEAPARTLVLNVGAITNKQVVFDSGVAGAVLTNTCPEGVTNTLYLTSDGIIEVGEGQTLVLDHDLCVMGSIHKRGLGTLVLRRKTYALPSLVTPISTIYVYVDGGQVIGEGPLNNVLVSAGKLSRTDSGPTPEFILADTPQASISGTSFITALNALATTPGPGVFTQNGGTVIPAINWGNRVVLAHTTSFVNTFGTGTYNLVNGALVISNSLWLGRNGGILDGHYGIFNQSGGAAEVTTLGGRWGEIHLSGGSFKLGNVELSTGADATFYFGGGRLVPKSASWLVLRSPTVFTGIGGDMTFAPAAGQAIQLSVAAPSMGAGGFVKEGGGLLNLSNTNAFTGAAAINGGTCTVAVAGCLTQCTNLLVGADAHFTLQRGGAALNTNLWLKVAADGKVHLDFTNEVEIGHLVLNGYECPGRGRRYGSSAHVTEVDQAIDEFFTGTGVLKVVGPRGPDGTAIMVR